MWTVTLIQRRLATKVGTYLTKSNADFPWIRIYQISHEVVIPGLTIESHVSSYQSRYSGIFSFKMIRDLDFYCISAVDGDL